MRKIARFAAETKPRSAASRHISSPAPWPLLGRLPARLADLPDDTRQLIGKALDARLVRLALDDDGGALVMRAGGR